MKRFAPVLALLVCLLAVGCPGQKPPAPPAASHPKAQEAPLVWRLSKSGLGFRLSNADASADAAKAPVEAKATPLDEADTKRIFARLPKLVSEPDDAKAFAMRAKSIPAPRPGKTIAEAFPPRVAAPPAVAAVPAGPLKVERHAPEGAVELAPNLTVTFTQPMVPVTSLSQLARDKPPVLLTPEPAGKWRWVGTRTLLFQPDKRFPMATEYAVEIPQGTRAQNGQVLAAPVHWTFSTPPLTLKRSWPRSSSVELEPLLYAEFDQAIDPAKVLESIELSSGRGGAVPIRLAAPDEVEANESVRKLTQQAQEGRWLAFRPQAKLPTGTAFTVRIRAGAPSAEGPRRTTKEQSFGFSTYGPLAVMHHSCASVTQQCTPLTPLYVTFSNPLDRKTVDVDHLRLTPEIPGLKVDVSGNTMILRGRTKGRTVYQLTVPASVGDVHGQTMASDAHVTFHVGPARPTLFAPEHRMVVLDPAAPKAYTIYSINEPRLRARVYDVRPEDWSKYVAFVQEWERPRKLKAPGKLVFDKVIKPKSAPDELVSTDIDLKRALKHGHGQALVVVESTRPLKKYERRPEISVWVQATELGVEAFVENDRVTGWVTKLADGTPQSGVALHLLGGASANTNADGLASVDLSAKVSKLVYVTRGDDLAIVPEPYFGAGTYAKRPAIDAVRWFMFDDRGTYKPGEEVRVKGWVRRSGTGRGGDLDAIPHVTGKVIHFKVRDPRWAEIGKGEVTVDDHGGFDLAFKLPANANLGSARVELSLDGVGLSNNVTSHSFKVQEFRRPEFAVTASSTEGPHFVGEHAVATVAATYYAGGGLPNAPVQWRVTRSTSTYTPPNRSEYHFGPEPRPFWGWRAPTKNDEPTTETWSARTDARGVHRLRVDFDALEPSYPMTLQFGAQVEDKNRQQWAGHTTMLVHPASEYVGLKLHRRFVRAGNDMNVELIVSDVDGALVGGRPVVVKAARLELEQEGEEYVEKEVEVQTCEVTSQADASPMRCAFKTTQGGSYRVWAVVTDEHGRKNRSTTAVWVTGGEAPPDRNLAQAKVSIVPDKDGYRPGEVAELLVIAPFAPAEGLLTVRRQGIVHVERFTAKTTSTVLKLKLDEALVPNVDVRVDLVGADVRDDASGKPDPNLSKRPAYAAGQVGIDVKPVSRTLAVTAAPKSGELAPGSQTQVDVAVRDASGKGVPGADVALVVADEAVLALSGYKTPDPVAVFYAPRPANVRALETRDHVVLANPDLTKLAQLSVQDGVATGYGRGMGGRVATSAPRMPPPAPMPSAAPRKRRASKAEAAFAGEAADKSVVVSNAATPIAMREDFAPLAVFAPRVKTDASGHATIPVKLPDNLTRYRVMAVAAAGERSFGSAESTITARLPVMVRPSAPRFLNFGDRFELPVLVQNQTDRDADVGVVVRASNATIGGVRAKRVHVAAHDRVEVRFDAAADEAGTARFQIGVASGAFADASQIAVPVYTPATTEAFATYGAVDQGAVAQPVKMPPGVFPQFGGLEITTSSTQLQALTDAVLYLVKYPYECNEQIASRVLAIAALRDVLSAFKAEGLPSPAALRKSMETDLAKLKRHQASNGGWGFWQEEPWPYLSVHVAHALVRAKEKGYSPDATTLRRAQGYLRNVEAHIPPWYGVDAKRAIIAYALYVRERMGDADAARAKRLIQEAGGVAKLPIEAVGWIWPTLSKDAGARSEDEAIRRFVANRSTETAGAAHFVTSYGDSDWVMLHSDRRADGVLLEAMIGDQPTSTLIPKIVKGLLAHRKAGRWGNTQENAFVLLALDRYFHTYEKVTPDFVARAWLGDRFAGEHAFKGRTTEYSHIAVPMQWLADQKGPTQSLVLGKAGPGRMYYRIGMQYAPKDLRPPPADAGFVVSRLYEGAEDPSDVKRDPDGTWRVRAGSKVRVRVTMVATSRRYHVALVDRLPAGLEPLNPSLAVTGSIPKDPKAAKQAGPYWYFSRTWYEHQNVRDERVEAFASLLWDGVWEYSYVAKATTPGTFVVPPAKAEEMYSPETFGRSAGDRLIVE